MSHMSKITHVFFCILYYDIFENSFISWLFTKSFLYTIIYTSFFFLNTSVTDITAYKTSPTQPPACYHRANNSIIYFDVWDFVTEGIPQTQPQLLHLSNTHCLP